MEKLSNYIKQLAAELIGHPTEYLVLSIYYLAAAGAAYVIAVWLYSLFFSKSFSISHRSIVRFFRHSRPIEFTFDIFTTLVGGAFAALGRGISAVAVVIFSSLMIIMTLISAPLDFLNGKLNSLVSFLQEITHRQKIRNMEIRLQRQIDRNRRRDEIAKLQNEILREEELASEPSNKAGKDDRYLH